MTRVERLSVSDLSKANVGALLDAVAAVAELVRLADLWRPTLPDVDDDMVLEAAVNGLADGMVTFNPRDFASAAKQFGIEIMSSAEAVKRLGSKP